MVDWKDDQGQMVDELACQILQYKGSLSSSLWACVLAVEGLSWTSSNLKRTCPSNLYSPVSEVLGVGASLPKRREYGRCTPWSTLWFYHEEDMRKWDGKCTSILAAEVHEL